MEASLPAGIRQYLCTSGIADRGRHSLPLVVWLTLSAVPVVDDTRRRAQEGVSLRLTFCAK
jgi:hypothetical protein